MLLCMSCCPQSYDMLPSEDFKNKGMTSREERALLCGVNKKIQAGNELIQGSVLLPNTSAEEEVKFCHSGGPYGEN